MKKFFICALCAIYALKGLAQHQADTLSQANYSQKATAAVLALQPVLSLNSTQQDSLTAIYKDYYSQLVQLKQQSITFLQRSQTIQQDRIIMDSRLKKVLSISQFRALVQQRQADYQSRVHAMDSLRNKHA